MKKLVLMFVAVTALCFASCGGQNDTCASANDSDSVAVDTLVSDSAVADSIVLDSVK